MRRYCRARGQRPDGVETRDPSFFYETDGDAAGWGYFGVTPTEVTTIGPNGSGVFATIDALIADETLVRGDYDVPTRWLLRLLVRRGPRNRASDSIDDAYDATLARATALAETVHDGGSGVGPASEPDAPTAAFESDGGS
ncbi:hypothetical protein [Halarchaeum salinum]|uniref:Uncharacterized protein n=1 Tax=Halarchaeum salinum TaxID=489912 RepID=A0AAV3S4Y1_9EURY